MGISRLCWVRAVLALCLGWLAMAPHARAQQEADARQAFEAGRNAYAEGNYEQALSHFQHSYELSHKPVLLYNIGMALDRLRRDEEAISAYEQYLSEVPTAENRAVVEQRLTLLRESVAKSKASAQVVPTPEQTARAAAGDEAAPLKTPDQPTPQPVYRKWWLWTSIGAVVAAGIVTGVLLSRPKSTKSEDALVVDGMTRVVRL